MTLDIKAGIPHFKPEISLLERFPDIGRLKTDEHLVIPKVDGRHQLILTQVARYNFEQDNVYRAKYSDDDSGVVVWRTR